MPQPFAVPFYNSKQWKQTRDYIMKRDAYMCQCNLCKGATKPGSEVHHKIRLTPKNINDISISLGEDNLMAVDRDCHFLIHETDRPNYSSDCMEGFQFDNEGNLIPITIIKKLPPGGEVIITGKFVDFGDFGSEFISPHKSMPPKLP